MSAKNKKKVVDLISAINNEAVVDLIPKQNRSWRLDEPASNRTMRWWDRKTRRTFISKNSNFLGCLCNILVRSVSSLTANMCSSNVASVSDCKG